MFRTQEGSWRFGRRKIVLRKSTHMLPSISDTHPEAAVRLWISGRVWDVCGWMRLSFETWASTDRGGEKTPQASQDPLAMLARATSRKVIHSHWPAASPSLSLMYFGVFTLGSTNLSRASHAAYLADNLAEHSLVPLHHDFMCNSLSLLDQRKFNYVSNARSLSRHWT